MYDMYWFLDSVPTKDLGLTKTEIKGGEDYYVIGGIAGDLSSIIEAYKTLGLKKDSTGRKFVKEPSNLNLAATVLKDFIDSRKIIVLGTVFYHSQLPSNILERPYAYFSIDNPKEVGINGMRGRSYAQTIWIFMENIKENPDINPIVCLDNEDKAIKQSVEYHFYGQLAGPKPNAKVKVQSEIKAEKDEPKGYRVSDIICSLLREYINFPNKREILKDLVAKTIKFDSKLKIQIDGTSLKGRFETNLVPQWELETNLRF